MTANAERILKLVSASTEHLTAEEMYAKLASGGEKMSLATVYNSLNKLYAEGLVRKIPMDGQPDRYDKMLRHDHLVCEKCGAISDVMLDDYLAEFSRQAGVKVESYDLKLFYLCKKCKDKAEEVSACKS
ncbi:MAG: transcriptional repressor [Candidatus Borkfalkiaceae bacterium]|nr:transcriptional repressor [Clostridia bacterium]MDY6223940.1 transcriptional repressor [Christensenellaceae bacterium]